jgi:hypothetical protein
MPPWVDLSKIRAASARDVVERRNDDRSRAERRELYARTLALAKSPRPPMFKFCAQVKAKSAPRPKRERTDETRAYFREYQRKLRAKQKAETRAAE